MSLARLLQQLDEVAKAMGDEGWSLGGDERTYAAFLLLSGAAPAVVAGILCDNRERLRRELEQLREGEVLLRLEELVGATDEDKYQNLLAPLLEELKDKFPSMTFSDPDDSSEPSPP